MLKKLPIGYSSLTEVISDNCVYIDKTPHVHHLVETGKYYFLSRPRRFGKSLLLDTIKQAFLGNQALFKNLFLEENWDWSVSYPVIHIDLGRGVSRDREEMEKYIHTTLDEYFNQFDFKNTYNDIASRLNDLILKLAQKTQQRVVILIDEYDKPILDNIDEPAIATQMREGLKNFYGIIKINDAHIKFVFLTGVTKFSKVSLFGGLNNLIDITLNDQYSDICGYTQSELDWAFKTYLTGVDKQQLKYWYNGYNFSGKPEKTVYNPFDILLFFNTQKEYRSYWIETGNPSFLLKLLQQKQYYLPEIEKCIADIYLLSSFDVDHISIEPLLLQTGYLTIKEKILDPFDNSVQYILTYPNHEVRTSLHNQLLNYFISDKPKLSSTQQNLKTSLLNKDFILFKETLSQFFASIPYIWYVNNPLPHYEGFYASIVYSLMNAIGVDAIPEDTTNRGRIDLSVKVLDYYLLFEFKVQKNTTAESAIKQIKTMNYPEKYSALGFPIYIVGIIFDEEKRNIDDFSWEKWSP